MSVVVCGHSYAGVERKFEVAFTLTNCVLLYV